MVVLMAQVFLALVVIAAIMAVCDGCRKILYYCRPARRLANESPSADASQPPLSP